MRKYHIQLIDALTKSAIAAAGGVALVVAAGTSKKVTLKDDAGGTIINPVDLVRGHIQFNVDDTVGAVDIYVQSPTGHFVVAKDVFASGPNSLYVPTYDNITTMVVPFHYSDADGETDTGFTIPGMVLPTPTVRVIDADSGITIDVGSLSTDSGDADGFIDGVSVATAGLVKASLANGAVTLGADLKVQDSGNAGDAVPEGNVNKIGKALTYTLTGSPDTATGFIILPIQL